MLFMPRLTAAKAYEAYQRAEQEHATAREEAAKAVIEEKRMGEVVSPLRARQGFDCSTLRSAVFEQGRAASEARGKKEQDVILARRKEDEARKAWMAKEGEEEAERKAQDAISASRRKEEARKASTAKEKEEEAARKAKEASTAGVLQPFTSAEEQKGEAAAVVVVIKGAVAGVGSAPLPIEETDIDAQETMPSSPDTGCSLYSFSDFIAFTGNLFTSLIATPGVVALLGALIGACFIIPALLINMAGVFCLLELRKMDPSYTSKANGALTCMSASNIVGCILLCFAATNIIGLAFLALACVISLIAIGVCYEQSQAAKENAGFRART